MRIHPFYFAAAAALAVAAGAAWGDPQGHRHGQGQQHGRHGGGHHGQAGHQCDGRCPMMGSLPAEMTSPANPVTGPKTDLGRMLYFEPRLSADGKVSCNSCHPLDKYGVDGKPVSTGHKGLTGSRNAPTVYNAAGHIAQFWDGRTRDVEEQAKGPVTNPVEMAMPSAEHAVSVLKSIPAYEEAFRAAFPGEADPVTFDNMAKAIGAFERKLVTPAPWDRYLKGDDGALTASQRKGWDVFRAAGCQSCHMGPYVGGSSYRKLGEVAAYPGLADPGRFEVTKKASDRGVFKVPSLRNVARTGPYFHDGSVASLEEAVSLMGKHQLGRRFTRAEIRSLLAFLDALTGEIPAGYTRPPRLPGL